MGSYLVRKLRHLVSCPKPLISDEPETLAFLSKPVACVPWRNIPRRTVSFSSHDALTHWGRVTHICVINFYITTSLDNGLSPDRSQAIICTIIWTNAWILLIGHLGTNFCEILIRFQTFSFKKVHLKISSAKWRPFCLGLNVLQTH